MVSGPAVALYLALWNRLSPDRDGVDGAGAGIHDPAGVLGSVWRERARVRRS